MKQFMTKIGETYYGKRFIENYDKYKDRYLSDFNENKNELSKEMEQFKLDALLVTSELDMRISESIEYRIENIKKYTKGLLNGIYGYSMKGYTTPFTVEYVLDFVIDQIDVNRTPKEIYEDDYDYTTRKIEKDVFKTMTTTELLIVDDLNYITNENLIDITSGVNVIVITPMGTMLEYFETFFEFKNKYNLENKQMKKSVLANNKIHLDNMGQWRFNDSDTIYPITIRQKLYMMTKYKNVFMFVK